MEKNITVQDATHRGINLLVLGLLSFTGIGLLAELIREAEFIDKLDDIVIILLAITAVIWYFTGRNRFKLTWIPFILYAISAVVKIGAVINEFSDKVAVGDDLGLVIPMVVMAVVTGIVVARAHRDQMPQVTTSAPEMMQTGD